MRRLGRLQPAPTDSPLFVIGLRGGVLKAGVHGLVMMGTVGENCSLDPHEKRELPKAAVEAAGQARCGCA
jgi:hypothetical protein